MSFSSYTVVVTCSLELRQDDGKSKRTKLLQETLNINWHPYVLIQPTGQEVRNRLNATTGQDKFTYDRKISERSNQKIM